jgi:branched-chain amino acid transport system substrate-binding protein
MENDFIMKKIQLKLPTTSLIALALSITAALTACTKKATDSTGTATTQTTDKIIIGEIGSMTGQQATFGQSTHNGVMMALKEINAAGGIKGKQVEVKSLDDQGKPEEAATAITKLITQDKVIAVIGEVASSISLAMAPIAQQYKIPMISPSSTNPKVTEVGDYIFRVCFIDPFQGTVMAKFASENLKAKRVAILRATDQDYSIGLADYFIETYKKMGGTITVDQSYSTKDTDFKSQLTSIRGTKPDAIFVPGYYNDVALISRQAKELGLKVPLLGGDGWDSPKLTEIAGPAINGSYFSNHYSSDDTSPLVQDFVKKYKENYHETPDALAALGYDSMKVLAATIEKTANGTSTEIRDLLAQTKDFKGVAGNITMDAKRNASKSAVVLKVSGGKLEYMTSVSP